MLRLIGILLFYFVTRNFIDAVDGVNMLANFTAFISGSLVLSLCHSIANLLAAN